MPTLAGSRGFTVIATVFDVAGLPEAHARLDVITTYIKSPVRGTVI